MKAFIHPVQLLFFVCFAFGSSSGQLHRKNISLQLSDSTNSYTAYLKEFTLKKLLHGSCKRSLDRYSHLYNSYNIWFWHYSQMTYNFQYFIELRRSLTLQSKTKNGDLTFNFMIIDTLFQKIDIIMEGGDWKICWTRLNFLNLGFVKKYDLWQF